MYTPCVHNFSSCSINFFDKIKKKGLSLPLFVPLVIHMFFSFFSMILLVVICKIFFFFFVKALFVCNLFLLINVNFILILILIFNFLFVIYI